MLAPKILALSVVAVLGVAACNLETDPGEAETSAEVSESTSVTLAITTLAGSTVSQQCGGLRLEILEWLRDGPENVELANRNSHDRLPPNTVTAFSETMSSFCNEITEAEFASLQGTWDDPDFRDEFFEIPLRFSYVFDVRPEFASAAGQIRHQIEIIKEQCGFYENDPPSCNPALATTTTIRSVQQAASQACTGVLVSVQEQMDADPFWEQDLASGTYTLMLRLIGDVCSNVRDGVWPLPDLEAWAEITRAAEPIPDFDLDGQRWGRTLNRIHDLYLDAYPSPGLLTSDAETNRLFCVASRGLVNLGVDANTGYYCQDTSTTLALTAEDEQTIARLTVCELGLPDWSASLLSSAAELEGAGRRVVVLSVEIVEEMCRRPNVDVGRLIPFLDLTGPYDTDLGSVVWWNNVLDLFWQLTPYEDLTLNILLCELAMWLEADPEMTLFSGADFYCADA